MNHYTQIVSYAVGAAAVLTALAAVLAVLLFCVEYLARRLLRSILTTHRLQTVRYWTARMEEEGLTIIQKEYREMVKARNPRTIKEFKDIDKAAN
jgi:hypothetical protein